MDKNQIDIIEARMEASQKSHDEMTQKINEFIHQLDNVYNQINHSMAIYKNDLGKEHIEIMQEQAELYRDLKDYLERILKEELDNNFYNKSGKFFFTQENVLNIQKIKEDISTIKKDCESLSYQWKKTSINIATIGGFIGLVANITAVFAIFKIFFNF
jgi:chaperonin cofactor prefoldin